MSARPLAVYADIAELQPDIGIERLKADGWEVRVADSTDPEVIARVAGDAEALLIGYAPVNEALLSRMPKLRIVATQSVGFDMIDLEACTRHGVAVSNVPSAATEEVATHALAMSLALLRGLPMLDRQTKAGGWDVEAVSGISRISSATLGILGLGRIGRLLAELAAPVFGRIVGFDPVDFDVPGVERLSLDEVVSASDVLSLHLPLTVETRHLLDRDRIARLPRGARIVNVSRGALIDAGSLLEALESGQVGAAALDVLETEPPMKGDPLVAHPRVLVTPHAAFYSPESSRDYLLHQAENVIAMHRDGRPRTPVLPV